MKDWAKRRLAELEAAAPKRAKKVEPFVKVPLWWIKAAAMATASPTALVLIELLRLRWSTKTSTFQLPNGRLQKMGVSREVKRLALGNLERAGLISVKRQPRKTPTVTLIAL
jgi:hypothetical protein